MRVVLSGYFGFGNIGDEAILEAMIIGLRNKLPAIDITVLTATPEKTSETYNIKTINRWDLRNIRKTIKQSDVLISGGGGLIQDVTGILNIPYYLGIILLAKIYNKTTVILGQGFGPIKRKSSKILARWILNKVDLIIVRDAKSSDTMIEMGINKPPIHISGDVTPILSLPGRDESLEILSSEGIKKDRPLIGLSIRKPSNKLPKSRQKSYYKTFALIADYMIDKYNAKLVFIPFHYPQDIIESSKVINLMKNPVNIILREYPPVYILGIISQMDIFIGMRLHSMIFSAMARVPMLGLSYDPKVKNFIEFVKQKCLKVDSIDYDSLQKIIEEIWNEREVFRKNLEHQPKALETKARINFEILFSYLKTIDKRNILGIKFDNVRLNEAIDKIDQLIQSGSKNLVVTPNPEMVVRSRKDLELKNVLDIAALKLPDGVGIVWASRVLKRPLKERVTGIDVVIELAKLCRDKSYKVFLLGSKPGIAEGAAEYLTETYPNLKIVGTYHGFFSAEEEEKIIQNINSLNPHVIIVGLGSPKQEKWTAKNLKKLKANLCITAGGSLDVLSGKVKRAPKIIRNIHLEWLYRLLKEPWRIKRQFSLIKFTTLVLIERLLPKAGKK